MSKRWTAVGVEQLMLRYPGLRVAYLERDPEDPGLEWSVLIRMDAAQREGRQRRELYRRACVMLNPDHNPNPATLIDSCAFRKAKITKVLL